MIHPTYSLGVLGAVGDGTNILLVRTVYGGAKWQLPGGYVEPREDIRSAIYREIQEELGVSSIIIAPVGTYIRVFDSNIVVLFELQLSNALFHLQESEISEAKYFALGNLPESMSHRTRMMIVDAIEKRRGQISIFTSIDDPGKNLG